MNRRSNQYLRLAAVLFALATPGAVIAGGSDGIPDDTVDVPSGSEQELAAGLDERVQVGRGGMGGPNAGDDELWAEEAALQRNIELEKTRQQYYEVLRARLEAEQAVAKLGTAAAAQTRDLYLLEVYGAPKNLTGVFLHSGRYWHRKEGERISDVITVRRLTPSVASVVVGDEAATIGLTSKEKLEEQGVLEDIAENFDD